MYKSKTHYYRAHDIYTNLLFTNRWQHTETECRSRKTKQTYYFFHLNCFVSVSSVAWFIVPLLPIIGNDRHSVFRSYVCPSTLRPLSICWPSVCPMLINTCVAWCNITVRSGAILTKLARNIHHVSGNCWKGFQGLRSKCKVVARWNALFPAEGTHQLTVVRLLSIQPRHTLPIDHVQDSLICVFVLLRPARQNKVDV